MRLFALAALCLVLFADPDCGFCRSAHSPRHSGMEAPGGPKQLGEMPMSGPVRTAEGGMGYTDAYGRTLTDKMPEERKPRQRPRPGAYGKREPVAELPDVDPARQKPVWSFR
ncbi:MAG: translation initiation factor IF-2 [Desulfovibrio sp.]|nr:translation initiation factor IF-2 [Desulfovibrio sp.]